MNFKLIFALSLIGLAVALGDVFFIPILLEPVLWLTVLVYSAYAIARGRRTWRFASGLALGVLNSLWITATHDIFVARYLPRHPREAGTIQMVHSLLHISGSARQIMSVTGPISGVFSGIVIGVFAVIAGMMMKPRYIEFAATPHP